MLKRGMKPSHPGQILKSLYIEQLGLNLAEVADNLGITRKTLSMLLNEHQGISAEMALRLAKAFNTTPQLWLNMQCDYDLWLAAQNVQLKNIKPFRRAKTTPAETTSVKRKAPRQNRSNSYVR